jgi:hypothetical protein
MRADPPTAAAAPSLTVTRPILEPAAPRCRPGAVGGLVLTFLDAFNRGDLEALDRLVAPDGERRLDFKWYSLNESDEGVRRPPRTNVAVYARADFLAYAAQRHRSNEGLTLVFMRSSTPQSDGREVGIVFIVRREADDLPDRLGGRERLATGKGAFDCSEGRMVVWSMGMHMAAPGAATPATYSPVCPVPTGWRLHDSPPVLCWHGPDARAASRSFRASPTRQSAQRACSSTSVTRRVRAMLAEYNFGNGRGVARRFAPTARVRLSRDALAAVSGRGRIAALVHSRYMAGEGWTAVRIVPRSIKASRATYRLSVRITHQGIVRGTRRVAQSVDCRSGLTTEWVELAWGRR